VSDGQEAGTQGKNEEKEGRQAGRQEGNCPKEAFHGL
jgi:hypothetical protein